ncbi:MAG: DUF1902 domain-containing protein [Candidatus Dadabacteria bacterium]|nr:DUF1902 domain-containing protein [Candidatus Dadabacteria bacterium]
MFWVKAIWDSESSVFVSESNIMGLHIEASTLSEFQEEMLIIAPELIVDNYEDEIQVREVPIMEAQWSYGKEPVQRGLQHS